MRSYQIVRFIILAQFLCTTLNAQSLYVDSNSQCKDLYFTHLFSFSNSTFSSKDISIEQIQKSTDLSNLSFQSRCKKNQVLIDLADVSITTHTTKSTYLTSSLQGNFNQSETTDTIIRKEIKSEITSTESNAILPFNAGIRRVVNAKCHGTSTGYMKARASGGVQ